VLILATFAPLLAKESERIHALWTRRFRRRGGAMPRKVVDM
jgi:hypothetical protein